jgi:hypothetical protein
MQLQDRVLRAVGLIEDDEADAAEASDEAPQDAETE